MNEQSVTYLLLSGLQYGIIDTFKKHIRPLIDNKKRNVSILFAILLFTIHACQKNNFGPTDPDFPLKLSEIGVFTSPISDLIPASDYYLYELSSELFSDYAEKQRLIRLPAGEQLTKIDDGLPTFPDGTWIVKTFYYWKDERTPSKGKNIIETRFLILENNEWKVAVYKWNDSQTEAYLLTSGNDEPRNWINEKGEGKVTTYHIPSNKECFTCHQSDGKMTLIGLKLYNLNRQVERNGDTLNQLDHFQQLGLINNFDITSVDNLADYNDDSSSDEERGRAYMEINCSHCHSPGGFSDWLGLDFRNYTPFDETGIESKKTFLVGNVESGFMPFIGTSLPDEKGIEIMKAYVKTL
ncbi:MAG: hypothetical protein IIA45_00745 [Bacteroidetes bacterium]|nr:hypothetical protein [Bacteroidota bacterium]